MMTRDPVTSCKVLVAVVMSHVETSPVRAKKIVDWTSVLKRGLNQHLDFSAASANDDFLCNGDSDSDSIESNTSLLYEGCYKSVAESVFSVLNLYLKNNLSKTSLKDILSTISDILSEPNRMPKSVYQLFKYVEELGPQIKVIKHKYCTGCCLLLNDEESYVCPACNNLSRPCGVFFEIDVLKQVKALFEHRNLASIMDKTPVTTISEPDMIKDITDGSEYARVYSNKQRGPYDVTLVLNTDGIALKKGSNADLWLILGTIAEIPEHLRESFIIVVAVWYDQRKPVMNTFLHPFCCKLRKSYDEGGILWNHPFSNQKCTSIISCPLFVADAPARAQVLNILNFNGRFGCCVCQIQTRQCRRIEGKKCVRVYPFMPEGHTVLRTHARMLTQGKRCEELDRDHFKGVKGQTIISILPGIDLSTCCIPEYMHSVLLGVVRQFICLWLTKPGPWNVKGQINLIDSFLLSIKPPDTFSRMPRSVLQWKKWKAHEYQNWLLFYSVPVMEDYLEGRFMQHWLCLVIAIFSLLKRRILFSEIDLAERLLRRFVRDVETLYGDRQLTYHVHQLIHLPLCVYGWGPLWSNSAFMFETFNGLVSRMVHGARNIGQEIVKNVKISQGFQVLKNNVAERDGAFKSVNPNFATPVGQCPSATQVLSPTEMVHLLDWRILKCAIE